MESNAERLVREGIAAFKAGRKEEAHELLARATELDERNEDAWLWLSAVVDNVENQQICLENVLAINPRNGRALQGLEMLRSRQVPRPSSSPPKAAPPPSVILPSVSPFDMNAPLSSTAGSMDYMAPDTFPAGDSAAEKSEPGGFHGSGRQVPQPTSEDYDAWVDGLNLGSLDQPVTGAPNDPFGFGSGPFQQDNLDSSPFADDGGYDLDPYANEMDSPAQAVFQETSPRQADPFALPPAPAYMPEPDMARFEDAQDEFTGLAGDAFLGAAGMSPEAQDNIIDAALNYLDSIPDDIKATRLPEQALQSPRMMLVGLAVVGIGVVFSALILVIQLVG